MPATDLANLLNFATHFRAFFVAAGADMQLPSVTTDLADTNKKAPYCEVHFVLGDPTSHRRPLAGENPRAHMHDAYNATVTWNVVTNRDQKTTDHEALCSKVRALMATIFSRPDTELPYFQLNKAVPMANRAMMDQERRLDVTQLPFAIHFSVRSGAWPV